MKTIILVIVFAVSVVIAIGGFYVAVSSDIKNISSWLQVIIEALGLPVIVYGLFRLSTELQKERWKPDIQIGVSRVTSFSEITKLQQLSPEANISQGYPLFLLAIRNSGKLAARFVKIHFEFSSFQDDSYKKSASTPNEAAASPVVKIAEDNPFEWKNN